MQLVALLTFLPPTIHAACYTPPKPPISHKEVVYPQKRDAQPDWPADDPTTGPSAISIDLPPQFLPPPWSPFSDLDSPYPSGGVSPWDDSGRAQMIDNEPSIYKTCPRIHLDCRKCPLDPRCQPWMSGTSGTSGSSAPIASENDGQGNCPLTKCDTGNAFIGECGEHARCTRGYCVCDLGWRGGGRHMLGYRGNEGLGALTVYMDPGQPCALNCDTLSCKEVPQLGVGVCWKSDGTDHAEDTDTEESGSELGSGLSTGVNSGPVGEAT